MKREGGSKVGSEVRSSFISRRAHRGRRVVFHCHLPISAYQYTMSSSLHLQFFIFHFSLKIPP